MKLLEHTLGSPEKNLPWELVAACPGYPGPTIGPKSLQKEMVLGTVGNIGQALRAQMPLLQEW